jgi:hypothetical protein
MSRLELSHLGKDGKETTSRTSKLPSLDKEGWPRHQANGTKPPLKERTGWLVQLPIIGDFNQPPRLRRRRWLRKILTYGAATPPYPRRGVRYDQGGTQW